MPGPAFQTSDDYPARALLAGHEGTAYFTVTVTKDGKPKDCVISKSSGWSELDKQTCKVVLRRARFAPATDDNGAPVEAPYSSRINWRIPR
jgi:protein TonB